MNPAFNGDINERTMLRKSQITETLKENIGTNICALGLDNSFLRYHSKSTTKNRQIGLRQNYKL
jgi:hypothetical protein